MAPVDGMEKGRHMAGYIVVIFYWYLTISLPAHIMADLTSALTHCDTGYDMVCNRPYYFLPFAPCVQRTPSV